MLRAEWNELIQMTVASCGLERAASYEGCFMLQLKLFLLACVTFWELCLSILAHAFLLSRLRIRMGSFRKRLPHAVDEFTEAG